VSVLSSVGTFRVDHPVSMGAIVELDARLVYTGRSRMHILVTICAGNPDQTAHCPMVFVALDTRGQPIAVPAWTPVTMLDLQRHMQGDRHPPAGTRPGGSRRARSAGPQPAHGSAWSSQSEDRARNRLRRGIPLLLSVAWVT
jgi:acyl-CoA hydrolase